MQELDRTKWQVIYFDNMNLWDVDAPELDKEDTEDNRFSVLEDPTAEDASLISAAPDLLAVVQHLLFARKDVYDFLPEDKMAMERAIEKARGDS